MKYKRQDGTLGTRTPEVGDRVWFIGEYPQEELQRDLKITDVKNRMGYVSVKPIEDEDPYNNGWAVWYRDITYTKPKLPEESYLYP